MTLHTDPHRTQSFRDPNNLWDDPSRHPQSFGCLTCPERARCGGMHNGADMYDCNALCKCVDKEKCDLVCRNRPTHFIQRVRNVGGFSLSAVPRAAPVDSPTLPKVIPFIDHKSARSGRFLSDAVALPLYRVVDLKAGKLHVHSREELADRFHISANATIVLSGVEKDSYIERWWELKNRKEMLEDLRKLDIGMITSPNYSVLTDVPRTDNLHAIKRIALTWAEMATAGLPAALHVNAHTEQDYQNWQAMIVEREEIATLAFEFATGCGRPDRINWHVGQLCKLASDIDRPLTLIIRGGARKLPTLAQHFSHVTLLETDSFSKTHGRRRAWISDEGKLRWARHPTPEGAPLDELFAHNVILVRKYYEAPPKLKNRRLLVPHTIARRATNRYDQSIQPSLLDNLHRSGQVRPVTANRHGVVAATKA